MYVPEYSTCGNLINVNGELMVVFYDIKPCLNDELLILLFYLKTRIIVLFFVCLDSLVRFPEHFVIPYVGVFL